MIYFNTHTTPLGSVILASDGTALTGLWFEGQKHFPSTITNRFEKTQLEIFDTTKHWLNEYFAGEKPSNKPPVSFNSTPFRTTVWNTLLKIPYGQTVSYGSIAETISQKSGAASARAVGNAVGHNPISIIVPCHRVIGSNGALTGYAGGIDKKIALLKLEKIDIYV